MTDDLVKRLREMQARWEMIGFNGTLLPEAADKIERQEAEIERLQAEVERLRGDIESQGFSFDGDGNLLKQGRAGGWEFA